mmetsp:Transcript_54848/g.88889  ORF Transcript_54848/g.88889 Transcript_54848/m.88889 type:complete len:289 (-) Transcript_54848:1254-2120(-)
MYSLFDPSFPKNSASESIKSCSRAVSTAFSFSLAMRRNSIALRKSVVLKQYFTISFALDVPRVSRTIENARCGSCRCSRHSRTRLSVSLPFSYASAASLYWPCFSLAFAKFTCNLGVVTFSMRGAAARKSLVLMYKRAARSIFPPLSCKMAASATCFKSSRIQAQSRQTASPHAIANCIPLVVFPSFMCIFAIPALHCVLCSSGSSTSIARPADVNLSCNACSYRSSAGSYSPCDCSCSAYCRQICGVCAGANVSASLIALSHSRRLHRISSAAIGRADESSRSCANA